MARTIRICSALGAAALALLAVAPAVADVPARDPLAAYLRARAADADGAGAVALADYAIALDAAPAAAPPPPPVALRAYREAVAGGDMALAARAAAILDRAGQAPMDAALFPLARAARSGDAAAARAALVALGKGRLRVLVPALTDWIARTATGPLPADPAAAQLSRETRMLLALSRPQPGLPSAPLPAGGNRGFRIAAAEILLGAHRPAEANALLRDDPMALVEAQAGANDPASLAVGISRLLLRVAEDLSGDNASPVGFALARAALVADPGYARAHLVLADRLSAAGEFTRAGAELDAIATGPLAAIAAERRITLLYRQDRPVQALAAARTLAAASTASLVDRARYADLLVATDRAGESLPWYRGIVADPAARGRWAAWLRYGTALDAAGRWGEAKKALRHAAALAPDEPVVLNQLGYTMVDRGDDVAAGTRLLEHAHALAADDAAIADSLGWGYYRGGDVARALPLVERAAAALPADADVADHLGDLYWTLGRRYEARYRWRAALVTAAPGRVAALTAKLADGLR